MDSIDNMDDITEYDGDWEADFRHGYGRCFYKNGDFFTGMWVRGKKEGPGLHIERRGDRHQGTWRAGMKDVNFIIWGIDGSIYRGNHY